MSASNAENLEKNGNKKIKCLVWDLDNTLWDGILAENDSLVLRENVINVIKTLDERGILLSIASKNDYDQAMYKLKEFALEKYFLYPQIHWNSKVVSIKKIAESINIGLDTIAFIDDQPFEREEVNFTLPDVFCIDAAHLEQLLDMPEMSPRFITDDSKKRRFMYLSDIERNKVETEFEGSTEEFLATLDMIFSISPATEDDLKRAEELTQRTHQLNTTGYTYSYDELDTFRQSDQHQLLVSSLEDKYGTYGKIGLALIELDEEVWTLKLLLMSCRVMSRGVGAIMINHIRNKARKKEVRLRAEFVSNDRNRMMYMTYKFTHFEESEKINDLTIFENNLAPVQNFPNYIQVNIK